MAVVNKFNVNKQEVRLDADIIENMSANDVSYNSSLQYDENTVGDKLSELDRQVRQVIYDVTANNDGITFASLSELLSDKNLSILIPTSVRHGGMSIRFVQSSDNKYIQVRCMAQDFTTDVTQWQGVDSEIIAGSKNLAESSAVDKYVNEQINNDTVFSLTWNDNKLLIGNGGINNVDSSSTSYYNKCAITDSVDCSDYTGNTIKLICPSTERTRIIFYNGISGITASYAEYSQEREISIIIPSNATSFRVCVVSSSIDTLTLSKNNTCVKYSQTKFVEKTDIADDLNTNVSSKVLSANQGYILKNKVSILNNVLSGMIEHSESEYVFLLTWNDNKLLRNTGGITNVDSSSVGYYNKCATTDAVDCSEYKGEKLILNYGVDTTYLAFYNGTSFIGTVYNTYSDIGSTEVDIPINATSFRLGLVVNSTDRMSLAKSVISGHVNIVKESFPISQKLFSQQLFGAIDYAFPTDYDYSQVLFFGQSFAQGGSSKVVDSEVIPNCYMYGTTVKSFTANQTFNPLQLQITGTSEPYEFPVVTCANALSRMYRRYGHDINVVASTAGTSGASLNKLINEYITNVESMHTNMKIAADNEGKSVGCFAIVFMQGESDYGGREDSTPDKDEYKALLMQVKNALQQSAMTNLGQTKKPLFFIYQTSIGVWVRDYSGIDNSELGVSMAQIEFAEENDDVILISPAYQVTRYSDGHPSSNGYRWLGEYYAKSIWQTLYRGFRYSNLKPIDFVKKHDKILIYLSHCVLPLQLNTWTLPKQPTYGFSVKADGVNIPVKYVSFDNNCVIVGLSVSIAEADRVSITYGGVGIGAGNICDSDEWSTWTRYLTDVGDTGYDGNRSIYQSPRNKDGDIIVGDSYPMNNFLTLFYKEL